MDRAIADDPAMTAALSDDPESAKRWMAAFASLPQVEGRPASHTLAKQVFWPLDEGGYHLLAPLFPSSLAHTVWSVYRQDRAVAQAARKALRSSEPRPEGYRSFPGLALQKFGGSNKQNISQLNSERRGENQLLASCPPLWKSEPIRPPLHVTSLFSGKGGGPFGARPEVRRIAGELKRSLKGAQSRDGNMEIRDQRDEYLAQLVDQLLIHAAEIQSLPGGWSADPDCRLNREEQCWLDPGRMAMDAEFAALRTAGTWREEIADRFGRWLNARLDARKMHFDDAAAGHWSRAVERELNLLRLEVDDV